MRHCRNDCMRWLSFFFSVIILEYSISMENIKRLVATSQNIQKEDAPELKFPECAQKG